MLNDSLIEIALQALSKHKISISELDTQYKSLNKTQGLYADDKKEIDLKLEKLLKETEKNIRKSVNAIEIPIPKDGRDFDEKIARALLTEQFKQFSLDMDTSAEDTKKNLMGYAETLKPTEKLISSLISKYLESNIDSFKGKDGSDGISVTATDGKDGETGSDGTGIADIQIKDDSLIVIMTTGEVKEIPLPKPKGKGTTPLIGSPNSSRSSFLSKSKDVRIVNPQNGDVLVFKNGNWVNEQPTTIAPGDVDTARVEIEALYKFASATAFKELTYTGDNITDVSIYTNAGKGSKLFTKIISYNVDNNIDSTSVTDEVNGGTITKTLAYTSGNITSVSSSYIA